MKKLNQEQSKWIAEQDFLWYEDLPTDFFDREDIVEILTGNYTAFRGKDYKGDSNDFVTDCFLSYTARTANENRFKKFFNDLKFLYSQAEKLEYYELQYNIKEIIDLMIEVFRNVDEHNMDDTTRGLLIELGFKNKREI